MTDPQYGADGKHASGLEEHILKAQDVYSHILGYYHKHKIRRLKRCAHHFEFDAAILDAEMCRLGMAVETRYNWAMAARGGFCTMNPHLTHWCCEEYIRERVSFLSPDLLITVPLAQLVRVLSPLEQEMCEPAHDAGSDSCAVWLALRELHRILLNDREERDTLGS